MDAPTPEELAAIPTAPPRQLVELLQAFQYAWHGTGDLGAGMAAVNEHLQRPLTYPQFVSCYHRGVRPE